MNKKNTLHEGTIKRHPDGFGFFIPDDPKVSDVYIPRNSMTGVMTNDRVSVTIEKERGTDRYRGEIVDIVQRGTKKVVGIFTPLRNGGGIIKDEGKGWGQDLQLRIGDTLDAKPEELVAAEILSYPEEGGTFRGKVVQVIGSSADPMNDIERVAQTLNIPQAFSKQAIQEASKLTPNVSDSDMKGRKDLRKLNFVTIDGATAKDFDDAIFVEQNRKGFKLYVAIADVSHYVRPGSAIDKDAVERGTSVYFPNFVIPMLPEILSNELCSLNPHLPRLALVAEMQMDFNGGMIDSTFYEAVIESHARVTYGEAQELIDGNEVEKLKHVKTEILRAKDLAKILMEKRFRDGSLDLEIPETYLMIDAGGNPIDIIRSERLFAHRMIEEMMLAANVAVATFLSEKEVEALYRIHEPPNPDAIAILEKYLRNFGGNVNLGEGKLQKRLTKALQEFEGKPEAQVLNILTLRSMSQAKYSSNNVGHFGLGFEFYTHFTSPIRRYPDLIVHRLIKSQVMPKSHYKLMADDDLATAGAMLSATEQRAVKAERQIQSIKKARFMEKHVGEEFDGIISSVTKFGVFVLLRQFEVDGLVHMENLAKKNEKFEFDEENLRLVAKRSGFAYSIGDPIRVLVISADAQEGKIDFGLAEEAGTQPGLSERRPGGSQARGRREEPRGRGKRDDRGPARDRDQRHQKPLQEIVSRLGNRVVPPTAAAERPNSQNKSSDRMGTAVSDRMKKNSVAEKYARENTLALGDTDELDLDAMPVDDHAEEMKPKSSFDPGKKLEEALRKRGLKPSSDLSSDGPPTKIGFVGKSAKKWDGKNRRGGDERRDRNERGDESEKPRSSKGSGSGGGAGKSEARGGSGSGSSSGSSSGSGQKAAPSKHPFANLKEKEGSGKSGKPGRKSSSRGGRRSSGKKR